MQENEKRKSSINYVFLSENLFLENFSYNFVIVYII